MVPVDGKMSKTKPVLSHRSLSGVDPEPPLKAGRQCAVIRLQRLHLENARLGNCMPSDILVAFSPNTMLFFSFHCQLQYCPICVSVLRMLL